MTTWALLLRAVNLGPRNKLAMADLRSLLTDLGHGDVRTVLNSGNASFTSTRRSRGALVAEIEQGLKDRVGLDVRATLRTVPELAAALEAMPPEIASASYVLLSFLFDEPTASARRAVEEWDVSPDRVVLGNGVAYLGYADGLQNARLQPDALERRLGVLATGRTPNTVRKIIG